MALFKGETTGWEDIQIKLGNFQERDPKGPSMEEISRETISQAERIVKQDFVNNLLSTNISEDDDDELTALRRTRLEQLKRQDAQSIVRRITKESYLDEVTEGSKSAVIVVMMDRGGGSSFLETECRKLAKEWVLREQQSARFYVGDIDELIGNNFPTASLPFAVIYSEGACTAQLPNATIQGVGNSLVSILKSLAQRSRETTSRSGEEEDSFTRDIRKELETRRIFNNESDNSSEESDDDRKYQSSKGYTDLGFERNVLRYN